MVGCLGVFRHDSRAPVVVRSDRDPPQTEGLVISDVAEDNQTKGAYAMYDRGTIVTGRHTARVIVDAARRLSANVFNTSCPVSMQLKGT
jgi:hypothetical protein